MLAATSGWRAMPSTAELASLPMPAAAPITTRPAPNAPLRLIRLQAGAAAVAPPPAAVPPSCAIAGAATIKAPRATATHTIEANLLTVFISLKQKVVVDSLAVREGLARP